MSTYSGAPLVEVPGQLVRIVSLCCMWVRGIRVRSSGLEAADFPLLNIFILHRLSNKMDVLRLVKPVYVFYFCSLQKYYYCMCICAVCAWEHMFHGDFELIAMTSSAQISTV